MSNPISESDGPSTAISGESKKCNTCGIVKPLFEYNKRSKSIDGYQHKCRKCSSEAWQKWKSNNPEYQKDYYLENKEYFKRIRYQNKFGLSEADIQEMLEDQNYTCAVCPRDLEKSRWVIDHDHKYGHARGILCYGCNNGLGAFDDSIEMLEAAIWYLKERSI